MDVRKYVIVVDETLIEGFKKVEKPVRIASAMAIIKNPYAGEYVEDITGLVDMYSAELGTVLPQKAMHALGITGEEVEAFGKGALVGLDGEMEHGSIIIHNLIFGTPFRSLCGNAKTLLPSAEKRAGAGSSLDIAIKHKMDPKIRSHHMSYEVRVPDAPRADEIVIVATVTDSGRAHSRSGNLNEDLKALNANEEDYK